ncbi:MAG TPA: glycosyltransferase, partial [Gemmata sp.]
MKVREGPSYRIRAALESPTGADRRLHVAHFVQRFPPALGGSEAYTARLCEHLVARGDAVTVWTSDAIELCEMWAKRTSPPAHPSKRGRSSLPPCLGEGVEGSGCVRRFSPLHFRARRYVLKALSLLPLRRWQCLTTPCNPVCPRMWRAAGDFSGPLDAVHATAFPYSFPIACGLRLARRRRVPFLLTPFLHLGDPTDPADRTRKQYTKPHLKWLLKQADCVFVQTRAERDTAVSLGVAAERVILQGLGVEPSECTGGDRAAVRAAWGASSDEVVIGHLA